MSNEYSIIVNNVAKMYKMYKSNSAKIMDLLGLSIKKNYEEFWPLKDINLKIKKGEKVGIIGRNGAGKTTLLSMISGNVKPTNGTITVNGNVNALFVLGTGFHPEFSGRENIYSSLAFQGITGEEAKKYEKEIIDFSELEEFIDQPVKTYSAGMYTRLAFTVATAIKPEILIIDEILGAGDAYFNAKALERMTELTSGGSTVLFVSHDLSSVQKMCERCIWIDKGKVREDSDTLSVIKAYSADVRRREEFRLLKKNKALLSSQTEDADEQLLFRFIDINNSAPKEGLPIHKITLLDGSNILGTILVGDSMDNNIHENAHILTDKKLINWGEAKKIDNKWTRSFIDMGAKYIHATGLFLIPKGLKKDNLYFTIEYKDTCNETVLFEVFSPEKQEYETIMKLAANHTNNWITKNSNLNDGQKENNHSSTHEKISESFTEEICNDIYGSEEIIITNFKILDKDGYEKFIFTLLDKITFRIYYKTIKSIENPTFVVAIYAADGKIVTQLISKEHHFSFGTLDQEGVVDFTLERLFIGKGEYTISIGIFKDLDLSNPIEQEAYYLLDRKYTFAIEQPFGLNIDMGQLYQDYTITHKRKNNG
jgi:lipopolysaccharide transport system ATP-binding protein